MAEEVDSDLIVMGTQGRTGLERLLLGSVAESVLARAKCPAMVVKTSRRASALLQPSNEKVVTTR
jgi:nucleotide-binding universal stress UspA family protein